MEIDKSNGYISVGTIVGSEFKTATKIIVKERFLRVFSAIYAKDALKNLSSTESLFRIWNLSWETFKLDVTRIFH